MEHSGTKPSHGGLILTEGLTRGRLLEGPEERGKQLCSGPALSGLRGSLEAETQRGAWLVVGRPLIHGGGREAAWGRPLGDGAAGWRRREASPAPPCLCSSHSGPVALQTAAFRGRREGERRAIHQRERGEPRKSGRLSEALCQASAGVQEPGRAACSSGGWRQPHLGLP